MGNGLVFGHLQGGDRRSESEKKTGKCRIWSGVNHESFQYPELIIDECPEIASKPLNFGIALSGGGFRAASLAIGTLRGLYLLDILSQSRYISSNSGSSWVNGPLSYYQGDIEGFLGEYLPPEECTISNLRRIDLNCHSYVICCGENLKTFLEEFQTIASMNDKPLEKYSFMTMDSIISIPSQFSLTVWKIINLISRFRSTNSQLTISIGHHSQSSMDLQWFVGVVSLLQSSSRQCITASLGNSNFIKRGNDFRSVVISSNPLVSRVPQEDHNVQQPNDFSMLPRTPMIIKLLRDQPPNIPIPSSLHPPGCSCRCSPPTASH
jgi:hypothetical protein